MCYAADSPSSATSISKTGACLVHSTCIAAVRFAEVFLSQAARVLAPLRHDPRTGPSDRVMERWTACHFACSDALPLLELDRTMLQDRELLAMEPLALDLSFREVLTTAVPSRSTLQIAFVKEAMCSLAAGRVHSAVGKHKLRTITGNRVVDGLPSSHISRVKIS